MADGPDSGVHHYSNGGKRWYDPSRVVLVLFAIVGIFIAGWSGLVFSMAYGASQKNLQQDEQIKAINDRLYSFDLKLDKQDMKLDRLLEKAK